MTGRSASSGPYSWKGVWSACLPGSKTCKGKGSAVSIALCAGFKAGLVGAVKLCPAGGLGSLCMSPFPEQCREMLLATGRCVLMLPRTAFLDLELGNLKMRFPLFTLTVLGKFLQIYSLLDNWS